MSAETLNPEIEAPLSLNEQLAVLDNSVSQLEAEAVNRAGTKELPDWWHEQQVNSNRILHQLKDTAPEPSLMSRFVGVLDREYKARNRINGNHTFGQPLHSLYHNDIGEDILGQAMRTEDSDGPIHRSILEECNADSGSHKVWVPEIKILQAAYGLDSAIELIGIGGDDFSNSLRPKFRDPNVFRWIKHIDDKFDETLTPAQRTAKTKAWISRGVQSAGGMGPDEADEYALSISKRSYDEYVLRLIENVDHFGAERLRTITALTGIHGLEGYSIEQLERMEALALQPEQTAAELATHDVTAVLINRVGDHSGILRESAATFDDEAGRTVFFEVAKMSDIYRTMSTLNKLGIKPSTVAIAAHCGPGQFYISDMREKVHGKPRYGIAVIAGRKLIEFANSTGENGPGITGYSMHGMEGLARVVENYMQPSRAIDDADEDEGRKKIIFSSCYLGAEVEMRDMDDVGQMYSLGMDSVVSRLGNDLATSGIASKVDIYGASEGIQMHRVESGVQYSGSKSSFDLSRPPLPAERIRVEDGRVTKSQVSEIVLRKAD